MERHKLAKGASFLKNALLCLIYAASLLWVAWWIISFEAPRHYRATKYLSRMDKHIRSRFFRTDDEYGSAIIYQSAPFILVALLSFAVIELRKKCEMQEASEKRSKKQEETPSVRMRTYPVIARSPMGVLTMADILFILAILSLVSYNFGRTSYLRSKEIELRFKLEPAHFKISLRWTKVASASFCMGQSAMIPFSLLWIPVSRGSPFLRLIRMPFEHAVKYHVWLAMLTLFMLTLHGIGYSICYLATQRAHKVLSWESKGEECSVVAGVVALIIGLTMWTTSLSFFRRRWYEIFFGVHHLYMVFFLFWLYHVIWTVHFVIIPVLLFMVDRFLRMLQSRHSVNVLSAKILESGALHLRIATNQDIKAQGLEYHALSSWYLRIPSLARLMKLQWHLFSITSTPMDGKDELSVVIKPFGKWTANLRDQLFKSSQVHNVSGATSRCPFSFKAGVEGPYGDESNFFLQYKTLVLIGGGIGITPLLALLNDVLHRLRLGQKGLPSSILLYHCVRKPEELCVLNSVDPSSIVSEYEKLGLTIQVFTYVTSHCLENSSQKFLPDQSKQALINKEALCSPVMLLKGPKPQGVSSISSKGASIWVASTIIASVIGFYVCWGLSNVFIVRKPESNFPNYNRAHLVIASMVLGTLVFGGMIVSAWLLHLKPHQRQHNHASPLTSITSTDSENTTSHFLSGTSCTSTHSSTLSSAINLHGLLTASNSKEGLNMNVSRLTPMKHKPQATTVTINANADTSNVSSLAAHNSPWNGSLQFGSRPHWNEIFDNLDKQYQGQNIGVLVSGPLSMQEDIAKQCRKHTMYFSREASSNVFHYHPISFDL